MTPTYQLVAYCRSLRPKIQSGAQIDQKEVDQITALIAALRPSPGPRSDHAAYMRARWAKIIDREAREAQEEK